jgi:signal transduction histidine kinase
VMAGWRADGQDGQLGALTPIEEHSISARILSTGFPQRIDSPDGSELDPLVRSEVGVPITLEGRRWGALVAQLHRSQAFALTAQASVAMFADVVAIAVGNAETKEELLASRRRLVHAGDDARRKLGRDLHDGAQQRLVYSLMNLQLANERAESDQESSRDLLRTALSSLRESLDELRALAAGLHPSILTNRGLEAAIDTLAERSAIPIRLDVSADRYPPHLEANAYFIAAEALTNIAKHARASHVEVLVRERGDVLDVEIRDDGCGGVDVEVGTGLRGLADRIAAVGGAFTIDSPAGQGTRLLASLPIPFDASTS